MPSANKVTITMQMEEIEKEFLKRYCEKTNTNYSSIIRKALREYFIKRNILQEKHNLFIRRGY